MKVGNKKIETEIEQKRNICSELKKEIEARLRQDEVQHHHLISVTPTTLHNMYETLGIHGAWVRLADNHP